MNIDIKSLQRLLKEQAARESLPLAKKTAAVLVPLLKANNEWHVLFIRRAEVAGDIHSGQVAFPGGRVESGESTEQAALREAEEEIALSSGDVNVVGCLKSFWSISDYLVTPHLCLMPWPYSFELQQQEVSRVFTMPLAWLMQTDNFYTKTRVVNGQSREVVYYREFDGEVLWGLTAAIVQSLCQQINESINEKL